MPFVVPLPVFDTLQRHDRAECLRGLELLDDSGRGRPIHSYATFNGSRIVACRPIDTTSRSPNDAIR